MTFFSIQLLGKEFETCFFFFFLIKCYDMRSQIIVFHTSMLYQATKYDAHRHSFLFDIRIQFDIEM